MDAYVLAHGAIFRLSLAKCRPCLASRSREASNRRPACWHHRVLFTMDLWCCVEFHAGQDDLHQPEPNRQHIYQHKSLQVQAPVWLRA
eukprot:359163-Chlamydomonas_euryale.AAC.4